MHTVSAARFRLHVSPFVRPVAIFLLVAASLLLTCISLLARIHPLLPLPSYAETAVSAYNTITHYPLRLFAPPAESPRPLVTPPRVAGLQYISFDAVIFALFILSNALAVRRNLTFGWVDRLRDYLIRPPATLPDDDDTERYHLTSPRYLFFLLLAGTIVFAIFSLKRAVAGTMDLLLTVYIVILLWAAYLRAFDIIGDVPFAMVSLPVMLFAFIAIPAFVLLMILDDLGLDLLVWLIAGRETLMRFWLAMFPFVDLVMGVIVLYGAFGAAAFFGELRFLVRLSLCLVLVLATLVHGALGS